jgi:hypothetical protein
MTLRALLIALTLMPATPGVARAAADYCLDLGNGSLTLVLKAFAPPAQGKCNEARGFYDGPAFLHGSACRSTDGSEVTFLLTAAFASARELGLITLQMPGATGSGSFCEVDTGSGGGCSTLPVAQTACTPKTVPVP